MHTIVTFGEDAQDSEESTEEQRRRSRLSVDLEASLEDKETRIIVLANSTRRFIRKMFDLKWLTNTQFVLMCTGKIFFNPNGCGTLKRHIYCGGVRSDPPPPPILAGNG